MKLTFSCREKHPKPGWADPSSKSAANPPGPEADLNALGEPYTSAICSLYDAEPQEGIDGKMHEIDGLTKIPKSQGLCIHDFYLKVRPEASIEIGLAYGYSTLFILAAINRMGKGHHTAIDPYQTDDWRGIGLNLAKKHAPVINGRSAFSLMEDRSDAALVEMIRSRRLFDFIYIDGNHRFDDVIVDFYLAAQVCAIGGHMILDDMWMDSIKTAVGFFRTNRTDFEDVPSCCHNIAIFKKVSNDERSWNEFSPFKVAHVESPLTRMASRFASLGSR